MASAIASRLPDNAVRVDFALTAYSRTFNPENLFEVDEAFVTSGIHCAEPVGLCASCLWFFRNNFRVSRKFANPQVLEEHRGAL
jgi:hypothetical protein